MWIPIGRLIPWRNTSLVEDVMLYLWTLWVRQSVQNRASWYNANPNGWWYLSDGKFSTTTRLFPWRSTLSIKSSHASHQYSSLFLKSSASEFTHVNRKLTIVLLPVPSIFDFSIFGEYPQSLQYIFLQFKKQGIAWRFRNTIFDCQYYRPRKTCNLKLTILIFYIIMYIPLQRLLCTWGHKYSIDWFEKTLSMETIQILGNVGKGL